MSSCSGCIAINNARDVVERSDRVEMNDVDVCDYLVIGGGSAGCVLANRLSERSDCRVTLIEAGRNTSSFWMRTPLGYGMLFEDPAINWLYESLPEPELHGHKVFQPRGKVLGGTSSINGMIYLRGQRDDFDNWARAGNAGWTFEDLLPFFKRSERNSRGNSQFHGADGPLAVSDIPKHPLADAFVRAGVEAGYPLNDDFNGPTQEGFGYNQLTIDHGKRCSAADAYLRPVASRKNLEIKTEAHAVRIGFENNSAKVLHYRQAGLDKTIRVRREIVLSAGTYGSPQLLQLSGIGPGDELRRFGIPVVAERPGVGKNLQDHFTVSFVYRCNQPVTINDAYNSPVKRLAMGLRYLATGGGLMATNASFCGAYIRSNETFDRPDLKFNFALWGRNASGRSKERLALLPYSSFTPSMVLLRPQSRGSVRLSGPEAELPPAIQFNFLDNDADQKASIHALRLLRHVLQMPAMAPYTGEEIKPGLDKQSDAELLAVCRERGRSNQHAVGTCRMGQDDMAVVDARLRVHGVEGLRVADASIMPDVVSGNTNASVIMIAEKAAAMMIDDGL
jgi:choline dehydrogenase